MTVHNQTCALNICLYELLSLFWYKRLTFELCLITSDATCEFIHLHQNSSVEEYLEILVGPKKLTNHREPHDNFNFTIPMIYAYLFSLLYWTVLEFIYYRVIQTDWQRLAQSQQNNISLRSLFYLTTVNCHSLSACLLCQRISLLRKPRSGGLRARRYKRFPSDKIIKFQWP